MKLALWRVAEFMNGSGDYRTDAEALGYSIDSRTVQPGDLFFAVRGDRLDGHDYVEAALERGAVAAVVAKDHRQIFAQRNRLIVVDDTLAALQRLAGMVRCVWGHAVVGVTGSAGKTTTKECIAHVLSAKYKVLEVGRQSQQSFWYAAAVAETPAGAPDRRDRNGHVARGRDCGIGQAGATEYRRGDDGRRPCT